MFTTDNPRRLPRRQTSGFSRIRLTIVSPIPPRPCPVGAYTAKLCRVLPVVAPRIALAVFAIDHGDGPPTIGGRRVDGSLTADDPSAYRRAGQRLKRLGVDVALLEVGPGTAGGPHGRYLLGLTDELTRLAVPYLIAAHHVRPYPLPDDANMLSALCRAAAGVVVSSDSARRALGRRRDRRRGGGRHTIRRSPHLIDHQRVKPRHHLRLFNRPILKPAKGVPEVQPIDTRRAELDRFVRDWIDGMLDSAALPDADRDAVTDAVRRCYERAGVPWPGRVVWAASPLAGQLLAARLARRHTRAATRIRALTALIWDGSGRAVGGVLAYGGSVGLYCMLLVLWLRFALPGEPGTSFDEDAAYAPEHWRALWIGGIAGGLLLVPLVVWMTARAEGSTIIGLGAAAALAGFGPAPFLMIVGVLAGQGLSVLMGGSSLPSGAWVTTLLLATIIPTVTLATVTGIVISWRTDPPAPLRYPDPTQGRLDEHLAAAVAAAGTTFPGPQTQVRNAVSDSSVSIDRSIDTAVQWAIRTGRRWVRRYPVGRFGGQQGGLLAGAAWLAASGAPVPPDAGSLLRDFTTASRAGWWWPHTRFVVIGERPTALHLERVRLTSDQPPDGVPRLHRADGPAAEWPDGYRVYAIHGIGVPADLVEDGWDVQALHRHPNSEVRRAAIELIGWAGYIRQAGWRLVATAPDPGNPPHELALYEDPRRRLRNVRVLVMTNGSPDRSGEPRQHAETVPDTIDDPVAAAAWQYGCPVEVYQQLQRRT